MTVEPERTPENMRRGLASFKFSLFETVAADPRLKGAPCTDLIIVYASFVTIDEAGRHTFAFATNDTVAAKAGVKCHKTAKRARGLLEAYGYLVERGRRNGVGIYELANPNAETIAEHVEVALDSLKEAAATRKADERKRALLKINRSGEMPDLQNNAGVGETPDLDLHKGGRNARDRSGEMPDQGREKLPPITLDDTLEGNLRESSAPEDGREGTYTRDGIAQRATQSAVASNPVVSQHPTSEGTAPQGSQISRRAFPIPRDEEAGRRFLSEMCVPEAEWPRLLPWLMNGDLFPIDIEHWMIAA